MTDLMPFAYGEQPVRIVVIDGEPWFVLADLCQALGLSNVGNVAARLDEDMKSSVRLTDGTPGNPNKVVVSEPGMYEVVIRSDKPEAVAFRRWITSDVLPTIRKTGSYRTDAIEAQVPKTLPDALRAYAREVEAREAAEAYAMELEPKAEAYTAFIDGDGTYSVGTVAKMHGRSQNKLFADLRNAGVLIAKGAMRNTPYQQYMHHFAVKAFDFSRSDGTTGTSYTTRVQPSGVDFIRRKLGMPAPLVEVVES